MAKFCQMWAHWTNKERWLEFQIKANASFWNATSREHRKGKGYLFCHEALFRQRNKPSENYWIIKCILALGTNFLWHKDFLVTSFSTSFFWALKSAFCNIFSCCVGMKSFICDTSASIQSFVINALCDVWIRCQGSRYERMKQLYLFQNIV